MLRQFWILGKMEEKGFTIEMEGKRPNVGRSFKQKNKHIQTTTFVIWEY